ncbi:MAG TPA: Ldh family oxidoreductase [Bacteroidetes bacterium]|nr:Ldh family oxidoreductase [Bacteroidota bacterium]
MYSHTYLRDLITAIFSKMGCSKEDASTIAEILLKAELRNIPSHGILRIKDYHLLWKEGRINVSPEIRIIHETPGTAVVDADNAFGMVGAKRSMEIAIEKASSTGSGWVATRNSNHFGIAGYYAMMALEHDMMGFCVTNANPTVAPTFAVERLLGTNPVAFAVPANREHAFVADFATTPIPRGKIALAEKKGEKLPAGFVQDDKGYTSEDPSVLRRGGAILPLGGDRLHGSHKGFCMSSMVDILSGVISGANFGPFVPPGVAYLPRKDKQVGKGTGHFFGAVRIDGFMPGDEFRKRMDEWIRTFRNGRPAEGQEKIIIPGDPEREAEERILQEGIRLVPAVRDDLKAVADELGIKFE